ncbi:MAG: hypothetical protein AAGA91_13315 [Pseudomonadota bacterium]
MKKIQKILVVAAFTAASGPLLAAGEKDCLLKGTVQHGEQAGQETTTVQIHSVTRYDEDARCRVRSGQKLEFKLPQDSRVDEAPSGSEVQYRYRTDGSSSDTQLISVGA